MAKKKAKLNIRTIAFLGVTSLGAIGWSGSDYQPLISARESGSRVITQIRSKIEALRDSVEENYKALTSHESSGI